MPILRFTRAQGVAHMPDHKRIIRAGEISFVAPRAQRAKLHWIGRIAAVIGIGLTVATAARSADTADMAEGMRLFLQKGNCQACHGWAGDGRKMDNQMPDGSNLRETTLDRASVILTIKCGRPGRNMPAFDKLAYTDGRCYGMKEADAKQLGLFDPPATLQPREIETLVDFLYAKVIGKGAMNRAKCVEYWGSEVEACRDVK
jgi:hypothetical protein